jgi:acyl carrier protein
MGPVSINIAVDAVKQVTELRQADGIPPITADTALDELGFDSLEVAELFVILEERCGAQLDATSVDQVVRVKDLTGLQPVTDQSPA